MNNTQLINRAQVASMLGVCGRTIYNWCRSNKMPQPTVRSGRSCYWSQRDIQKWLGKNGNIKETAT